MVARSDDGVDVTAVTIRLSIFLEGRKKHRRVRKDRDRPELERERIYILRITEYAGFLDTLRSEPLASSVCLAVPPKACFGRRSSVVERGSHNP